LTQARERLRVIEDQLNADHRSLSRTENQYRDQLTERNTLLLTVYQYLDKMIGAGDRSPVSSVLSPSRLALLTRFSQRKPGQTEPKPFSNFSIFHDSLIHRVKAVNQIQVSFERRTKEIENKFSDQFAFVLALLLQCAG
jgi:hypothetical protein